MCVAAGIGAYQILPWRIPEILFSRENGFAVLVHVRFPRVILSAVVGAMLAISGATLQGIFRNPLADPGLIGVTAGAGLGATLWIVLIGGGALGVWGLPIAAFGCGILVTIGVWKIAEEQGRVRTLTLLLAGIALNSFAGAGIGLMTFLADDEQLRSLTFWLLGGFGGATWPVAFVTLPIAIIGLFVLLRQAAALNAMSLGESEAYHLGVSTDTLKRWSVFRCCTDGRCSSFSRRWYRFCRTRCPTSAKTLGRGRSSVCPTRLSSRRCDTPRLGGPILTNRCRSR